MSTSGKQPDERLKVTDKRMFTAEGDLKEEFRSEIDESAGRMIDREPPPAPEPAPEPADTAASSPASAEPERPARQPGENPGTMFTHFLETLIVNAYMSLGLASIPGAPPVPTDPRAARQMIDIIQMLKEKTSGNLSEDESAFLEDHLAELKLVYVQQTKTL